MHLFSINILIFLCLLHILNPRVHLQEDGFVYRHGILCFKCIGISSLVGRRGCRTQSSTYKTAYTDAFKTHYTVPVYTTVFLKMNPRV